LVYSHSQFTLEEKYLPKFEEIERQAHTKLNILIDEAYLEYHKKKEKGELTIPILFNSIEKANKLETEIDVAFQNLLTELKTEIEANGLKDDLAKKYEQHYVKSKRKNKLQIFKHVTFEGNTIIFDRKY
jgi:hypothetical protein